MLIRHKEYYVCIIDLEVSIVLEPSEQLGLLGQALHSGRAQYVSLDLCNKAQVLKGTHNVIDACMELNVKRLVYTSCIIYPSFPSIFFDDVHGIHNGNETMPYVHSPNDHYSATKAKGEALVIKANGTNGLLTCCIRPSSIFEPGDRLSMPSLSHGILGKSSSKLGRMAKPSVLVLSIVGDDVVFPTAKSKGLRTSAFLRVLKYSMGGVLEWIIKANNSKEKEEVQKLFNEYRMNGGLIDRAMAGIMVGVFSKVGLVDELVKLLQDKKAEGTRLDQRLYQSALNAFKDARLQIQERWIKESFFVT
ncbi:hypothetical protein JHK86_009646 [Glycine max]|nr:hypothetical protein JHK86_009646 [Glycine max]